MDSGPFSAPQPSGRPAARPEQAYRPKEPQAQPVMQAQPQPHVAHHTSGRRDTSDKKSPKKWLIALIIAVVVIILGGIGCWMWMAKSHNVDTGINSSEYQAVFTTNGQVYLGKLSPYNGTYLRLTNAFIVVSPTTGQSGSDATKTDSTDALNQTDTQLVKITSGILEPQDEMFVARSQVLFYENLKPDGKAAKLIQQNNS